MWSGMNIQSVMEEYKEMNLKKKAVVGELRRKGDTLCKERISPSSCGDMSTLTTRKGILCRGCILEKATSLSFDDMGDSLNSWCFHILIRRSDQRSLFCKACCAQARGGRKTMSLRGPR